MMIDFCYDEFRLAYIIVVVHKLGARSTVEFLERVYEEDSEFLHPKYRKRKKDFILSVLYWVNYLVDADAINIELTALERDLKAIGKEDVLKNFKYNYSNIDLFFMNIRLTIRFLRSQEYVRMKVRTILHNYGYQRRSNALMNHVWDCMLFYHIYALRNNEECDIYDVNLDDMITFRLS